MLICSSDFQNKRLCRRLCSLAAIALVAVLVCGCLDRFTQFFTVLENVAYGQRLEMAAESDPALLSEALKRVAVVTANNTTFDSGNPDRLPGPPVPRADYVPLIQELTRDGARVIVFDILFDRPQPGDAALARAMRQSGRVLLACEDSTTRGQPHLLFSAPALSLAAASTGHAAVPDDANQAMIDRIAPVIDDSGRQMPALSVEAARLALGITADPLRQTPQGWRLGRYFLPTDGDGTFKVRYFDTPDRQFGLIPLEEVIRKDRPFQGAFRGKVVVIGNAIDQSLWPAGSDEGTDLRATPVGAKYGVEIQANAIATLLTRRFIREASPMAETIVLVVLTALAALFAGVWPLKRAAVSLSVLVLGYGLFNVLLFVKQGVDLHLIAPAATVALVALGVLVERGQTEEQEKTHLRGLLHRYVSPQIAAYILQHPELLGRAGRRATGTVLFSDIRGFTSLSEQMPPEELVRRLNEYFQAMTEIVFRHDGTVATMVGDAMLALFGVPVPSPDHARQAVSAAVEMQETLRGMQDRWRAQGRPLFNIGVGINTGEMVVGEVGGQHLTQFTVHGLQVNIASRVESLNKELGTCILITRATHEAVAREVDARGPVRVPVKGVEEPIEVFEILGWLGVRTGD